MNIVICDDETGAVQITRKLLDKIFAGRHMRYSLLAYNSGEEMLRCLRGLQNTDLFILDYKMAQMTGMEVAKELRNKGVTAKIVFVSSVVEAAPQGYEVNVFRYVVKNLDFAVNLSRCINSVIDEHLLSAGTFTFLCQKEEMALQVQDILYFESIGHKVRVYLSTPPAQQRLMGSYEFYNTLAEVEQKLPPNCFLRVYRAFIVNLQYVQNVFGRPRNMVVLTNGTELPLSRSRSAEIKKEIMVWLGNAHSRNSA